MKTVYRIEGEHGIGMFRELYDDNDKCITPYVPSLIIQELGYRHGNFNNPCDDGLSLSLDDKEWFCAYKTFEKMCEMVKTYEFEKMHKFGFNVYEIQVTEFQEGDDQFLFTKESIVNKKCINDKFLNQQI